MYGSKKARISSRILRFVILFILLVACSIGTILAVNLVHATEEKDDTKDKSLTTTDFYSANDVNFYNECGSGGTSMGDDDITKFAAFSIGSTFDLEDSVVEKWFLSTNTAVIGRYGINSSNIGQITKVVKEAGVSPMFFYGYTVNEGGGAGGYINHWFQKDMPGTMLADAKKDAEYLKNQSRDEHPRAATGGGEPASMPTAAAQKFLDSLPLGSIGRIYIAATSAATAEIEEHFGEFDRKSNPDSARFGDVFTTIMQRIKDLGGDPMNPGKTLSDTEGGGAMSSDSCDNYMGDMCQSDKIAWYKQWGEDYTSLPFNYNGSMTTVREAGCSFLAATMIIANMTGKPDTTPNDTIKHLQGIKESWVVASSKQLPESYGLKRELIERNVEAVNAKLKQGCMIWACGNTLEPYFASSSGHCIAIRALCNGKYKTLNSSFTKDDSKAGADAEFEPQSFIDNMLAGEGNGPIAICK